MAVRARPASGRRGGSQRTAAVPRPGRRTAQHAVPVRPASSLPRTALAGAAHRAGRGGTVSRPYYLCPHCHQGQFPADRRTRYRNTATSLPVCAACRRWWARRRPSITAGADEGAGRSGGDHQIGGAHGGSHRRRYRRRGAAGDPASRAAGSAHHRGRADSHSVCANGRDRRAGSEERNRGTQRQNRRPTGPHARSQAGMRVHPDRLG